MIGGSHAASSLCIRETDNLLQRSRLVQLTTPGMANRDHRLAPSAVPPETMQASGFAQMTSHPGALTSTSSMPCLVQMLGREGLSGAYMQRTQPRWSSPTCNIPKMLGHATGPSKGRWGACSCSMHWQPRPARELGLLRQCISSNAASQASAPRGWPVGAASTAG